MDDGSTDGTFDLLQTYVPRITVFRQKNMGLGGTLDELCARATGELVARLDSDDIWHPRYLEAQRTLFEKHPNAVALFTGHVDFDGDGGFGWTFDPLAATYEPEIIQPLDFLKQYDRAQGRFLSMSYCCVPRAALARMGPQPFKVRVAEDVYFLHRAARFGPVIYFPAPLAAYRFREGSLASNRLSVVQNVVRVLETLQHESKGLRDPGVRRAFKDCLAVRKREYAKLLMGAGKAREARRQICSTLSNTNHPVSLAKSLGILLVSCLPATLHPRWPSPHRVLAENPVSNEPSSSARDFNHGGRSVI